MKILLKNQWFNFVAEFCFFRAFKFGFEPRFTILALTFKANFEILIAQG
jgi:hypothetical protein